MSRICWVMKNSDFAASNQWRHLILLTLVLGSLIIVLLQAPIKQDLAYHHFIDTRNLFGIPNFYNVISNLPFLLTEIAGVLFCTRQASVDVRPEWLCFFVGITLVSIGSAYYHLNPDNQSLVWDRLPMTMAFMGLFAALLGAFVDIRLAKYGLLPMILLGLSSVFVWHWLDDLRFYVWVPFVPLLLIPVIMLLYRSRYTHSYLLIPVLILYGLAKMLEAFDAQLFSIFHNELSGHAIKHVFAGLSSGIILFMLRARKFNNK